MEETLDTLAKYGYIILFLYSFGGGFVALLAGSVLSFMGKMDISLVIFISSMGNFIGSQCLFFFARYQKQEVLRQLQKHRRKIALVRHWLKKYGSIVIFIQKYIYAVKSFVPIVMGVGQYPPLKFSVYNLFASFLWGASIGLGAYFLGEVFVQTFYALQDHPYLFPVFGIILLACLFILVDRFARKKH
ncbi:hypothetical protein CCZ01_00650 [Helicobacter monodelphidis]|uniref:DedA family protein n=1 Tax=Helicobacter sp. 15-1451 TaxID=2004995 RepID=UPI000DCC2A5A|nr:DedA family protein [Helicobacter sp. 15-1451]RAX59280.1 hypothetical protein CCZ01_00650 [Helicobacter sp. 15-1451]